jgi:hypothetical protein
MNHNLRYHQFVFIMLHHVTHSRLQQAQPVTPNSTQTESLSISRIEKHQWHTIIPPPAIQTYLNHLLAQPSPQGKAPKSALHSTLTVYLVLIPQVRPARKYSIPPWEMINLPWEITHQADNLIRITRLCVTSHSQPLINAQHKNGK